MDLNRRHFLLGSAAAAGAASAQTGQPVVTAVIGTGGRGTYLLRGVLQHPGAKVAAVCDNKPDRLDRAATVAARDNPATYSDWRRVIERKDVDAVVIATPPYLHSEMAVAALQAGKHVYCEKPIGVDAAQVRALVRAARNSKRVFVAGQQMRTYKRLGEAVRKIREGAIGDILMVKAQRQASGDLSHTGSSSDWFFDVKKGGGYLIEQSVHNLDLCNWVIGARPVRACGFGGILMYKNQPPGRTIFDCGSITYEYPGGVKLSFTQNVFQARGVPGGPQYVQVYGSKATADLLGAPTMYPLDAGAKPSELAPKQEELQNGHFVAFYDSIVNGTPSFADIKVGAEAALTSILGHEAMVRERVVNWSDLGVEI